jgi:hypothetical protein
VILDENYDGFGIHCQLDYFNVAVFMKVILETQKGIIEV